MSPRILVVDDDPLVLKAIRLALNGRGWTRVDCAATASEAMALARLEPVLALVDIGLGPGVPSGIDLVADLRAAGFDGYVCMLTGDDDAGTMLRSLVAGADDYLLKRCCEIGRDVAAMLERQREGPAERAVLDPEAHGQFLRSAGVTEEQVAALCAYVGFGFPENKELAARLGISEQAASKLVRRAEEKLGVRNRGQLVRLLTVLSGFGVRERRGRGEEARVRSAL